MQEISTCHHNLIPLPWDHYGYRAVAFTLGISSRLERVFYFQGPGITLDALLVNQPDGPDLLTHSFPIFHRRR